MSGSVSLADGPCQVLSAGSGPPLGLLADVGGWAVLPEFAQLLADSRQVVAPALPGQVGGGDFRGLDDLPDWLAATLDRIEAADLVGADFVGFGIGGLLLAELAALSPASVGRLVLVAPFGLYDAGEPTADPFAARLSEQPALWSARPDDYAAALACPDGEDPVEWQVTHLRGQEAAARLLWPLGDLGLAKRLRRIQTEVLLVWGDDDRIVPPSYAKRFADAIAGPVSVRSLPGAGHRVDFDQPRALAEAIQAFLG